jgi:hypothetical protein
MTAPRTAVSKTGGKRRYIREVAGHARHYISVTSCTSLWGEGPWKIPYGAKTVGECAIESHVSGKLSALYDADADAALKYLKGAPFRDRDAAGAKGTAVHEAWEQYLKAGTIPEIEDEAVASMLVSLKGLMDTYEVEWERSEQTVFSDEHGWAGTMDGIVTIQFPGEAARRRCVCDIKTSRTVNHPPKHEYAMQIAALAHGEVIAHDNGLNEPMPEVDPVGVIFHVRPDKPGQVIPVLADDDTYHDFLLCVRMALAEHGVNDRVTFLPPLGDPNDETSLLTGSNKENAA